MVNAKAQVYAALSAILPTSYELAVDSSETMPCITYMETGGNDDEVGDTLIYSRLSFTVKIWAKDIKTATETAVAVDSALHDLGYERTGSNELTDGSAICKVLNYEIRALEGSASWI